MLKRKITILVMALMMLSMPLSVYAGSSAKGDTERKTSSVPAATTASATIAQSVTTVPATEGKTEKARDGSIVFRKADGTLLTSGWAVITQEATADQLANTVKAKGPGEPAPEVPESGTVNVWKYFGADGKMLVNTWVWVTGSDGKRRCYYLGADGTCFMNGVTPDGFTVDATGAWYVGNTVQIQ